MQVDEPEMGKEEGGEASGALKRGLKRDASDSNLFDFDRFEKRLRALSIKNADTSLTDNGASKPPPRQYPPSSFPNDNTMQIDATPTRIYIPDLDAELADDGHDDEAEEKLIFLPDIEKKFSRLPEQVLANERDRELAREARANNELVLYDVPHSLTMGGRDEDSVRRVILEARARAREKAREQEEEREREMVRMYENGNIGEAVETAHGYSGAGWGGAAEEDDDPDAMDIG